MYWLYGAGYRCINYAGLGICVLARLGVVVGEVEIASVHQVELGP